MTASSTETVVGVATSAVINAAAVIHYGPVPPVDVIFWSCMGGLVPVWLAQRDGEFMFTWAWAFRTLMLFLVSAGSGVVLSAGVLSVAHAGAPWIGWLVHVPQWVMAATMSAVVHWVAPLLLSIARLRLGPMPPPPRGGGEPL